MSDKSLLFSLFFDYLTSSIRKKQKRFMFVYFMITTNIKISIDFFCCILCSKSCSALTSFLIYSCDWVFSYICVYSNQLSVVLAPCWTSSRPKSIMLCKRPLWSSGISSANTPTSQFITLIWTIFIDIFQYWMKLQFFLSPPLLWFNFFHELVTMHSGIVLSVKNTCLRIRLKWCISDLLR